MTEAKELLLLGCGNMGGALLKGWLNSNLANHLHVTVVDPYQQEDIASHDAVNWVANADALANDYRADVLFIAIKPQMFDTILPDYAAIAEHAELIVSVAAGKSTDAIARYFPGNLPIIRLMPNLPALVGKGVSGCYTNLPLREDAKAFVNQLGSSVGKVVWLEDEADMHALTAVSGSGPAYAFYFIDMLMQAAKEAGLSQELARELAEGTVLGAAHMLQESKHETAESLRVKVTSPGGTTEAGLSQLMKDEVLKKLLQRTVHQAKTRSEALQKEV